MLAAREVKSFCVGIAYSMGFIRIPPNEHVHPRSTLPAYVELLRVSNCIPLQFDHARVNAIGLLIIRNCWLPYQRIKALEQSFISRTSKSSGRRHYLHLLFKVLELIIAASTVKIGLTCGKIPWCSTNGRSTNTKITSKTE